MYKRKEIIGDCTLFLGDNKDIIDSVECDAVVTDPPYGINYKPFNKNWDKTPKKVKKIIGDNEKFNPYFILNKKIPCILWGSNNFNDLLPVGDVLIWDKRTNKNNDKMLGSPCEIAYKSNNLLKSNVYIFRLLHGGVVNADSVNGNNEPRFHPTQKPIEVMKWCISHLPKDCQTILDPFMGSGSTLVACAKMSRKGIGIELDENYFNIACKRVEDAYRQPDLFYGTNK